MRRQDRTNINLKCNTGQTHVHCHERNYYLHEYELGPVPFVLGLVAVVIEEAHRLVMVAVVMTRHLAL